MREPATLLELRRARKRWQRRHPLLQLTQNEVESLVAEWNPVLELKSFIPLTGGACNTNLRVDFHNHPPVVLRLYTRDSSLLRKDQHLQPLLKKHQVPVPTLLFVTEIQREPPVSAAFWEFVEGEELEEVLTGVSAEEAGQLGRGVGEVLAQLHQIRLPKAGLLGPTLELEPPFDSVTNALLEHALECLDHRAGRHLSEETEKKLRALLKSQLNFYPQLDKAISLAHSDFNGTNMLAAHTDEGWKIVALLDWEFSFAGTSLFDMGQMLRYRHLLPDSFVHEIPLAYKQQGGLLLEDWERVTCLLDLANLCGFLNDEMVRPDFFAHIASLVEMTLKRWEGRF